jgi:subtilisin family serine protease
MMQSTLGKIPRSVAICAAAAATMFGMAGTASAEQEKRVIVKYKAGAEERGKAAVIRARGKVKLDIRRLGALAAVVPAQAVQELKNDPGIDYVEDDVLRYLPGRDPEATAIEGYDGATADAANPASGKSYFSGQQVPYGITLVQADQMPNGASKAGNRKLCIIDSGYDLQHEDLNNNGTVSGEYDTGTGWWYTDENSHGTHVAGTVAALNNRGVGVVGVIPARQMRLHIVKVFDADGWAYSSELADAAYRCADAGSNVISMSLSGPLPSATEQAAFDDLAAKGILSVAAASNAGTPALRYPAAYDSVVSVGALDAGKQWATFSNFNHQVELSGPGVDVLSTVPMGTGSESLLSVGGVDYQANGMQGSPKGTATAPLADFGLGTAVDPAMAGKVCLISRGAITFAAKVQNCEASGGVGAVIYNNAPGNFSGTLGGAVTGIPSMSVSQADGMSLTGQLGQAATLTVRATNYAYFSGTSMATPHVSAVAALVWSYFPMCNAEQIRNTLAKSAEDLGDPGRDHKFGYGLVQARAAYDRLQRFGCNN